MQASIRTASSSKTMVRAGYLLSALAILFLLFDVVGKVLQPAAVVESMAQLGYPASATLGTGLLLLACLALYVFPRTAVLGAVLLTGYLGGAVASQARIGAGLFPMLFPILMGALVWGGLFLREARLRALVPLRD
jgi:hypothetical protein